jgi:hypothetical protein
LLFYLAMQRSNAQIPEQAADQRSVVLVIPGGRPVDLVTAEAKRWHNE